MNRRVVLLMLLTGPAWAEGQRYPQPVLAGDLLHRQVLRPVEQQNVLGRVAGVVRRGEQTLLLVDLGGTFSLGTRRVAVPVNAVALLGEHVAVMDLSPDQLQALPTYDPAGFTPLAPGETLRVGLTRPFH